MRLWRNFEPSQDVFSLSVTPPYKGAPSTHRQRYRQGEELHPAGLPCRVDKRLRHKACHTNPHLIYSVSFCPFLPLPLEKCLSVSEAGMPLYPYFHKKRPPFEGPTAEKVPPKTTVRLFVPTSFSQLIFVPPLAAQVANLPHGRRYYKTDHRPDGRTYSRLYHVCRPNGAKHRQQGTADGAGIHRGDGVREFHCVSVFR